MQLFRTEMLCLHPPAPPRAIPSRPRYGSRGAGLSRYGRAARCDAIRDALRDDAPAAGIASPRDDAERMRAA